MAVWLAVKVVSGCKVLFGSKIISCSDEESFGGLLSRLEEERFSETPVQKILIQDDKGQNHEVQLDAPLALCSPGQFNSRAIVFHLAVNDSSSSDSSKPNAFQILMSSQRRILLPRKVDSETPKADQRMYNDIIDLLASWNIGWSPDTVETVGKKCVKVLCGALWYLDPHHSRFRDRSIAIPTSFEKFHGYNDWKKKKEKCPQLSQAELDRHVQAISTLLSQPWSHKPHFKPLQSKLVQLVEALKQYLNYLKKHNEAMKVVHSSSSIMRPVEENILLETRIPVPSVCEPYQQLQEKLSTLELYHPLFLNDFSPSDRYVRKHWLNDLQLEFPVKMYRFCHGNSLGTMTFIWRLPSDISSEDGTATAQAIATLNSQQLQYCTRQMRKDFINQYSRFVKAPTSVLRHMFKQLVHDSSASASAIQQVIDDRVSEAILDAQDPEIILDLRKQNGVVESSFDAFWEELQKYLDEIVTPVNERRHGDTMYLPIAISVRDLRERIEERLVKRFPGDSKPIPSAEWIRLQFWPRNPYANSALRYTGRFKVKYAIQARQMRKTHPDARYVAVLLQYIKFFAVSLQEQILVFSVDDKAIVPVGEPSNPISSGVRGHNRSLVTVGGPTLAALDHDFHLFGVVPSVSLCIEIPDSPNDSFFSGQPFVSIKDKIVQPSSPYRHSTELAQLVRENYSNDGRSSSKPVMIILSDGGPDHRVTYGSVKVSMIALFRCLNLDALFCMQMCPYQSWTNPAERVMSTLNLALQNVSLMRDSMGDPQERAIKYKNTIGAIRSAVDDYPELEPALLKSTSSVISLLEERFARMKLKGKPIKIRPAATTDDIVDNFDAVHFIDNSLVMGKLQQENLKDASDLKAFMNEHCHSSHYLFQVKKCAKESCLHCSNHPVRLPQAEFENLKFIPLPLLNATKDQYRKFSELYGQHPSEEDRPSRAPTVTSEAKEADKENKKLLVAGKVRRIIVCSDCSKPRCVYAAASLASEEKNRLKCLNETEVYTCGSTLFPPESPLHRTVVCRQALSCSSPMETQYYSGVATAFPPVCWYCASPEEMLTNDEFMANLRSQYAVVRPICFLCRSDGKRPATWGASNVAKRPKRH